MHYRYTTQGTCSQMIEFDIEEGKIKNVSFYGGCNGNLTGISALVEGADARQIADRLANIRCGFKDTSCPDQLSQAIRLALQKEE